MRIGSLFSGAGGLDRAVEEVFGGHTVWHSEVDSAASKVLAARWPGVPNLGDITAIDWAAVEPVDVLCGGFPCTDVSAAGKRAGMHGTRSGLWSHMRDAIDTLKPRYVVIENVRGLLNANANRPMEPETDAVGNGDTQPVLRAIGAVLGDLADIGTYDARWVTVSAASVGAPHRRERVFIVATDTAGRRQRINPIAGRTTRGQSLRAADECDSQSHANPARDGWHEGRPESARLERGPDAAVSGHGPVELLPTPCVTDRTGTRNSTAGRSPDAKPFAVGDTLTDALTKLGHIPMGNLLPTPNAQDGNGGGRFNSEGHQSTLPGTVRELLPTPRKSDGDGGANPLSRAERMDDVETRIIRLLQTPSTADGDGSRKARGGDRSDEPLLPGQAVEMATNWGKYGPAIARWEQVTRPAPAPTEPNTKGNPRLSARFSEWLMGWPDGWVTDIDISRNDQLRCIGNGVCPQQAHAALIWLLSVCEVAA